MKRRLLIFLRKSREELWEPDDRGVVNPFAVMLRYSSIKYAFQNHTYEYNFQILYSFGTQVYF